MPAIDGHPAWSRVRLAEGDGSRGTRLRILFAPHEIAGQMGLLARGMRRAGHEALAVTYYEKGAEPTCDINLGFRSGTRSLGRAAGTAAFATWAAQHFDVFHFFYSESLLPRQWDLPVLHRLGKRVFVHFRGSDVVSSRYVKDVLEQLALGRPPADRTPVSTERQAARLGRWRRWADDLFVSTPDMLEFIPDGRHVPQVIDLGEWPGCFEDGSTGEVNVVHAPTDPAKKGTPYVVEAVEVLRREGLPVRLQVLRGRSRTEVREAFQRCHIGIDQVVYERYGNVAIELMATGKPVLARLGRLRHILPDAPVVDTSPASLADRLRELIVDPGLRRRLGRQGRAYVERRHELDAVTASLLKVYRERPPRGAKRELGTDPDQ